MATRRSQKRRQGGSRSDLIIRDGQVFHLKCDDCFFGVSVEIPYSTELTDGREAIIGSVPRVECRFDSPQPKDPENWAGGSARKFPVMDLEDWCGCFRPRNPKCKGQVHCTVEPRNCGADCKYHVDYESQE